MAEHRSHTCTHPPSPAHLEYGATLATQRRISRSLFSRRRACSSSGFRVTASGRLRCFCSSLLIFFYRFSFAIPPYFVLAPTASRWPCVESIFTLSLKGGASHTEFYRFCQPVLSRTDDRVSEQRWIYRSFGLVQNYTIACRHDSNRLARFESSERVLVPVSRSTSRQTCTGYLRLP